MRIFIEVNAQDLIVAGAPLTAVKQAYSRNTEYEEVKGAEKCDVTYVAVGKERDNFKYHLIAKTDADTEATAVASITKVVWGGTLKDSYVLVSES